jgi:transcriptional regulator with XRE-family HTH domain
MATGIDLMVERRTARLTQEDVAQAMGVTKQYISRLEGSLSPVTRTTVRAFRAAIKVASADAIDRIEVGDRWASYAQATEGVRSLMRSRRHGVVRVDIAPTTRWDVALGVIDALTSRGIVVRPYIEDVPLKRLKGGFVDDDRVA